MMFDDANMAILVVIFATFLEKFATIDSIYSYMHHNIFFFATFAKIFEYER